MTVMTLNWIFIAIILLSALIGLIRGFFSTLLSTIIWAIALCVTLVFHTTITSWFHHIPVVSDAAALTGTIVSMLVILIVGGLIAKLIHLINTGDSVNASSRLTGAIMGIVRGVIAISALIFIIGLTQYTTHLTWKNSEIVNAVNPIVQKIKMIDSPRITGKTSDSIKQTQEN